MFTFRLWQDLDEMRQAINQLREFNIDCSTRASSMQYISGYNKIQ